MATSVHHWSYRLYARMFHFVSRLKTYISAKYKIHGKKWRRTRHSVRVSLGYIFLMYVPQFLRAVPEKTHPRVDGSCISTTTPHGYLTTQTTNGSGFSAPTICHTPRILGLHLPPPIRIWKIIEQQFLPTSVSVPNLNIANNLTQQLTCLCGWDRPTICGPLTCKQNKRCRTSARLTKTRDRCCYGNGNGTDGQTGGQTECDAICGPLLGRRAA